MHPDTRREIGDDRLFDNLFKYEQIVSAVAEEEYDPTKLLCVDVRYNFPIINISKLQPSRGRTVGSGDPAGRYDLIYRKWIDKVLESDARDHGRPRSKLTPHLDRDWHKPTRMPEIFPELDERAAGTLYQDFVLAYGLDYLRREKEADDPVVVFYDPTQLARGGARSVVIYGQAMDQLLAEFKKRPDIAAAARAGFERELEQVRQSPEPKAATRFARLTSAELFAELLEIARNRANTNVETDTDGIIRGYFECIGLVLRRLRTDLEPARTRQKFANLAIDNASAALDRLQAEGRLNTDVLQKIREKPGFILKQVESQW